RSLPPRALTWTPLSLRPVPPAHPARVCALPRARRGTRPRHPAPLSGLLRARPKRRAHAAPGATSARTTTACEAAAPGRDPARGRPLRAVRRDERGVRLGHRFIIACPGCTLQLLEPSAETLSYAHRQLVREM